MTALLNVLPWALPRVLPKALRCFAMARRALAGLCLALLVLPASAGTLEVEMPVPTKVIYPGEDILSAGLGSRSFLVKDDKVGLFAADVEALAGFVARRTLLPGRAIRLTDLVTPDAVKAGAPVTLVYRADGLTITGLGTALQSAAEGEVIRVRNTDSGVTVTGKVAGDGSVLIEG